MLNLYKGHKTLTHLRWTFIQRLITLIISMLLAMCLGSMGLVTTLNQSLHEATHSPAACFACRSCPSSGRHAREQLRNGLDENLTSRQ